MSSQSPDTENATDTNSNGFVQLASASTLHQSNGDIVSNAATDTTKQGNERPPSSDPRRLSSDKYETLDERSPEIKPQESPDTQPESMEQRASSPESVEVTIVSERVFPENNTDDEDDANFAEPAEVLNAPNTTVTTVTTTTSNSGASSQQNGESAPSGPSFPNQSPDVSQAGSKDPADLPVDESDFPIFRGTDWCYPLSVYKKDWRQVKNEILAGFIVAFAQIPETVAYAFIAGVDPIEALQATYIVGFITSFFGGRPTMISGATGAIAAVQATLPDQGYIYPVCIVSGILITGCGAMGFTKFARLIPHSAMIGFLNGLAIIIAESQVHVFHHTETLECVLMAIASVIVAAIVYFLPRYTKVVPSSLAGITAAVIIEYLIYRTAAGVHTKTIGDLGM